MFGSDREVAALVVGSGLAVVAPPAGAAAAGSAATINDGIKSQVRRTIDRTIVLDECCIVASIKIC
jgi:hypothetical protein